MTFKASQMPDF
jgi:hypothetical protein